MIFFFCQLCQRIKSWGSTFLKWKYVFNVVWFIGLFSSEILFVLYCAPCSRAGLIWSITSVPVYRWGVPQGSVLGPLTLICTDAEWSVLTVSYLLMSYFAKTSLFKPSILSSFLWSLDCFQWSKSISQCCRISSHLSYIVSGFVSPINVSTGSHKYHSWPLLSTAANSLSQT